MVPIWAAISLVVDLLFYFLVGPHVPPGKMTTSAGGAQFDFNILIVIALPVMIGVWVYMAYAMFNWRASKLSGDPEIDASPTAT